MKNIFDNISNYSKNEIFTFLLENQSFRIERILSFGTDSLSNDWFDQEWHEWVVVIQGYGILEFEDGTTKKMKAGDYELIPARTKHKVIEVSESETTIWLAVHFE